MSSKSSKQKTQKTTKKPVAKPVVRKAAAKSAAKAAPAKPAVKAPAATPAPKTKGRGVRYSPTLKQEVIDFVAEYNAKNGRGGQSAAARKFGITILTVSSWLKGSGKPAKAGKGAQTKATEIPSGLAAKVKALLDLGDEIRKLQAQHASLSAAIRSAI